MLGMYNILPMLKGWEYKHDLVQFQTVNRSQTIDYEFRGLGWVESLAFAMTDSEIEIEVKTRSGKSTGLKSMFVANPAAWSTGPWTVPFGATRFLQPSRTSTAGYWEINFYQGVLFGSAMPFLDRTLISTTLKSTSTQDVCLCAIAFPCVLITDITQFIKSIRAVEGNRNMYVDPTLLEYAEQFTEEK